MLNKTELHQLFESFNQLNILIVGDVMIDSYVFGNVSRISPEAPVPIVAVNKKENRLGGAANVALNIKALGANPVLCSVIGNDENGKLFCALLQNQQMNSDGIILSNERTTTVKTRIIGNNHQMLRVDEEMLHNINQNEEEKLIAAIENCIKTKKIDAIIFEDYDKGCLTPAGIERIVSIANKHTIPTAVDPKKNNFLSYKNVTLFKPNLRELKEGLKIDFDAKNTAQLNNAVNDLLNKLQAKKALITLSELGVYIATPTENFSAPAHIRNIADVSGAGDTVISVATLCLAKNTSNQVLAELSNLAGGLVCEKLGVVSIDKNQLLAEAEKLSK
ncbi:MAG: bifunctional ADP-heptose synthase [Bacteroidota bacterium]